MKIWRIVLNSLDRGKKGLLIFSGGILLLLLWLGTYFDVELMEGYNALFENLGPEMLAFIGGLTALTNYEGFVDMYLFNFSWMWFSIYFVMTSATSIPSDIENKTIDLILSKPINRHDYFIGRMLYHWLATLLITILGTFVMVLGTWMKGDVDPSDIHYGRIIISTLITLGLQSGLVLTAVFFSTFMDSKKATGAALGVMILFFFIGSFWTFFPEPLEFMKYLSLFQYAETGPIMILGDMGNLFLNFTVLILYSVGMVIGSIIIWKKRDIPV